MELTFAMGHQQYSVEIKDEQVLNILMPQNAPENPDEQALVKEALHHPIGTERLRDIVHPGESIVLVTSDLTRPMPTWKVMDALLDELYEAGCDRKDITLLFARGSHRAQTEEEMKHLAGERAWNEITCADSDMEDTVNLGTTKSGTPVQIDRRVAEADRIICLGNVEFHYFAGYSGGAKAIMPGMSTPAAIRENHRLMVSADAHAGKLEGNPVRMDLEEACAMVGVNFILNVVLNPHKEIIYAAAGDVTKAHRDACAYLDTLYRCPIAQPADIVIVSQGGAPKDLNLYQTQKALDMARHAVRQNGVIILIGSCREGYGNAVFEKWMTSYAAPQACIDALHENFVLGGHKAAAVAMTAQKADIYLVSEMDPALLKGTFLKPYDSLKPALKDAFAVCGKDAKIIAMPYGGSTLPQQTEK